MNFFGGFFAIKVNEKEKLIEPVLGWVIERETEEVKNSKKQRTEEAKNSNKQSFPWDN